MDNLEQNTNPLGEAGATASQGQLDDTETQTVETEAKTRAVSSDNTPAETSKEAGEASNPWDENPKFKGKTADEIYKSYQELEKAQGTLSQKAEVANLLEDKFGVTPEQLKAQIEAQELQARQAQYGDNPLAPVLDEVDQLKERVEAQEAELVLREQKKELDNFLKENPEFEPNKDKLLELGLTLEQDKSFEDIAQKWFGGTLAQGQQDAYNKIETKKNTQATSPTNAAVTKPDLADLSVEEMEKILPHAGQ